MSKVTLQSVFNQCVRGLAKQNFERAVSSANKCCYFVPGGKRCAIGQVMSTKTAKAAEHAGLTTYSRRVSEVLSPKIAEVLNVTDIDEGFTQTIGRKLQLCHDAAGDAQEVISNLVSFAEVYGLTLPKELQ